MRAEQEPWLESAHAEVSLSEVSTYEPVVEASASTTVQHEWTAGTLIVDTGRLVAVIDPARGGRPRGPHRWGVARGRASGAISSRTRTAAGCGAWGVSTAAEGSPSSTPCPATSPRSTFAATPTGGLSVVADGLLDGRAVQRCFVFEHDRDSIEVRTTYAPADRRTVTLRLPAPGQISGLRMDQPGGVVTRPVSRQFDPTFWPVASWLATDPAARPGGRSLAVGSEMARAVSASADGRLEIVVARNATKELAWRVVPIPACPARGHERGVTTAWISMWWPGDASPSGLVADCIQLGPNPARRRLQEMAGRVLQLSSDDAGAGDGSGSLEVLAVKPADRGDGIIVRFIDWDHRPGRRVHLRTSLPLGGAQLCDVRERDLEPLEPLVRRDGTEVVVEPRTAITSVRLLP